MPSDDKPSAQDAAAEAARSVQERREMTRKAAQAEAADDPGETDELQREAGEHRRASHEAEAESDQAAREADADT